MRFKHPRNAFGIGLAFMILAAIYYLVSHDAGGATTLFFLGSPWARGLRPGHRHGRP